MKVSLFFAWYDFWIGWYYDREGRVLYVCPLPCCVLRFERRPTRAEIEAWGREFEALGHAGDGGDGGEG